MNWKDLWKRGGDAVDGTNDGAYDHKQTEARMAAEARRLAQRAGDNPVKTAYVVVGFAVVLLVLLVAVFAR